MSYVLIGLYKYNRILVINKIKSPWVFLDLKYCAYKIELNYLF